MVIPFVVNSLGEKEPFSIQKVTLSAKRAGASGKLANKIAQKIAQDIYTGISTKEIFQQVKKMLSNDAPPVALRFSLKEAMHFLGPTGFPFEKYVAEIFEHWGFKVKTNQLVSGHCCSGYEIDLLVEKEDILKLIECKFRQATQGIVQIEVALANYARFLDIKNRFDYQKGRLNKRELKSLLVTNTRFSSRAIQYSVCSGVELLGWKYPKGRGLEYFIDNENLYPITILPSFQKEWGEVFSQNGIMMVKDVFKADPQSLGQKLGISASRISSLIKDADLLLEK
jgi:Holliday junction resolvase-like predicted endonuclease